MHHFEMPSNDSRLVLVYFEKNALFFNVAHSFLTASRALSIAHSYEMFSIVEKHVD